MNERRKPLHKRLLTTILFGIVWSLALVVGLQTLLSYERSPGNIGDVRQHWPMASKIPRPNDRAALVMVAHPQCPCTRASMDELAKIMARVQGKVSASVLFLEPEGAAGDWQETGLRRTAARIPGVTVLSDINGVEARSFGAETSGHTFLYDRDGTLLFSGGITQARGHAGDNSGENAIIALVNNHRNQIAKTSVFGCSLVDRKPEGDRKSCLK